MADKKISQLSAASTPLSGSELVELVQGGNNVKATAQDVADLVDLTTIQSDITTLQLNVSNNTSDITVLQLDVASLQTGKQDNITLTTTGTSGAATLVGSTLNIPQYSGGGSPTGSAGGDLSGTYPNPTVSAIHSIDMQSGLPTSGDVWVYGGTPPKWQHQMLHASQVDNDSAVTGTHVDDALDHLNTTKVETSRTISTSSPLSGGGDLSANRTISIADAAADGTTKGAAAFTASDFNSASGVISIDYANGQAASGSNKGFLTSSDWTTFNSKEPSITVGTIAQYWRGDKLWQTLDKTAVGLGNVDNTSDSTKNSATATLTNKRITARTGTVASTATPSINIDNVDYYSITALATAITSVSYTGTPTTGQTLWISITDNGTARAIAWGSANWEPSGNVALPTTTVAGVRLDVAFIWNEATSKWRCVGVA